MPILFSAVVCDNNIVSNFASCDGNFTEILQQVLAKISPKNEKMTYSHGHHLFHYIMADRNFYFCITDKQCQRSRAFLFLNEIERRFRARDSSDFAAVLAAEMRRYSEECCAVVIRTGELDEINSIGVGCSESLLGEQILLVKNQENLTFSTISYVGETPEKITVTVNNSKLYVIVVVAFVIALGIAIYVFGPVSSVILTATLIYSFVSFCS